VIEVPVPDTTGPLRKKSRVRDASPMCAGDESYARLFVF
jgi:hypothetical protein